MASAHTDRVTSCKQMLHSIGKLVLQAGRRNWGRCLCSSPQPAKRTNYRCRASRHASVHALEWNQALFCSNRSLTRHDNAAADESCREHDGMTGTWLKVDLSFALPFLLARFLASAAAAAAALLDDFFAAAAAFLRAASFFSI